MNEAITSRDELLDSKIKLEQKKQQYEESITDISSGKKKLKNLFKSSSSKSIDIQNLKNNIELIEREISQYKKIINIVNVYLAEVAIPKFKEEKLHSYYRILSSYSANKINDAHLNVTFWTNVQNVVTQFGF